MKTTSHRINFTVSLVLIAANLRMAIICIPPLTKTLENSLNLSQTQIGFLTSIPLICFGVFSIIIGYIVQQINVKLLIAIFLSLLAIFNFVRVYSQSMLYIGTFFTGLSITALNILIPVIILQRVNANTNKLNGIYTATFNICASIVSIIIVPLSSTIGWQASIQLLSVPALLGLIGWMFTSQPNSVTLHPHKSQSQHKNRYLHFLTTKRVWILTFFFGMQSFTFYVTSAWLPSILNSHHMTTTTAGILFGIFQFIGVPASYIAPQFMNSNRGLFRLMIIIGCGYIAGFILLSFNNGIIISILACLVLGLTSSASFALALSFITTISPSASDAGAIGGIVQSFGYLIASSGPTLTGIMIERTGNWNLVLILLVVISFILMILGISLVRSVSKKHVVN